MVQSSMTVMRGNVSWNLADEDLEEKVTSIHSGKQASHLVQTQRPEIEAFNLFAQITCAMNMKQTKHYKVRVCIRAIVFEDEESTRPLLRFSRTLIDKSCR
eukprot:2752365-Amphidinium_carterae.2